jgi:hypothetical protein
MHNIRKQVKKSGWKKYEFREPLVPSVLQLTMSITFGI